MRAPLFCLLLFTSTASLAEVQLHRLYSDGVVLQRQVAVPISGQASDENAVTLLLNDKTIGTAQVKDGKWSLSIPKQEAGGPHTLTVKGSNTGNSQAVTIKEVYFGDVWLASGQSNMELTMARVEEAYPQDVRQANYPLIREFTVPDRYNFIAPQDDYEDGNWQTATANNIRSLSAVAYYFARQIYLSEQVPIGIINASLGGSPIEAWMSEKALSAFPEALATGKRYADDALVASIEKNDQERQSTWYTALADADTGYQQKWLSSDYNDSAWETISMPSLQTGKNESFAGVWWLRRAVTLPKAPRNDLTLRLGRIVDADEVYVNGVKVGNTTYQYPPRRYTVPASLLHKGKNQIAIRVVSNSGETGFVADKSYYLGNDDARVSLTGDWKFKIAAETKPLAPQTFVRWQPMGLFNGMIAPALGFPIKGALWYQGESNTSDPTRYKEKLATMIGDWRAGWDQGDFPFLVVQLTNFMQRRPLPTDTPWAQVREQQVKIAEEVANTASIVTLDIGEWNDIHPVNKATVGKRLALAAENLAYARNIDYQGPVLLNVSRDQQKLVLQFAEQHPPLILTRDDNSGFAIAGKDKVFRWAKVATDNLRVTLSHPDVPEPKFVRYAWGDNPVVGLADSAGLPAAPFAAAVE
ncbi:sialate O-acetylesterase [Alteromonas pelagimontana]|uniref:Sialate O-acetylesterase n=1 Tax=Alteromonas pelagimontana TaxID=1858656 RepID=A0A6M4MDY7_9ALTE|nr:sialate O-acetylesterase [Alteromonas pelagimontana]QJR81322.1 sialate O-acetylesterase [Alteromonas pelagimontana]